MSLTYKSLAGRAVTILTIACAVSLTAQAQVVAESLSKSEPKKAEAARAPIGFSKNIRSDKTSETSSATDNPKTGAVVNASTAAAKTMSEVSSPAPQPASDDEWHFVFSPYFWMAGLHGTPGGPNRTIQVDESFSDIFDSLKFAFMGVFEAHKGSWAIQTDVEYVSIESDRATPGPLFSSANAKIKTFVFTPEVAYRIYNDPYKGSFLQVLGGTRIWHISTDLTFNAGVLPAVQISESRNWVDAVVGLRGKAAFSEKVFFLGRFDVGGGGAKFTYQLFGGLGYNINKKIAFVGGYRVLDVNYDKNNFLFDMSQRGPIMGVGFRF